MMDLRDAVVVITGASSGIGRATARAFAHAGARVVMGARELAPLETLAEELRAAGGEAMAVACDVTDEGAVRDLADVAVRAHGRLDVWVNNAGLLAMGRLEDTPADVFRQVVDTNLMGYVNGAWAALPRFRLQGAGILVNVASVEGKIAAPWSTAYAASKHAVVGFSSALRQELRLDGARGIHVSVVLPATIDTPLFQHAANFTGVGVRAMPPVYPPEKVARAIVSCARAPRREVYVGASGRAFAALFALAPGLSEHLFARMVDRSHLDHAQRRSAASGNAFGPEGPATTGGGWLSRRSWTVRRLLATAAPVAAAAAGALWVKRRLV